MEHGAGTSGVPVPGSPGTGPAQPIPSMSVEYVRRAEEIAARVLAQATEVEDGSLSWNRGYGVRFQRVDDAGIFNGRIGEGLFLAALHASTRDPALREAALRVLAPLRARIRAPGSTAALAEEIGFGLTGLGAVIYALVRIGRFLDESALPEEARALAAGLTPGLVRRDDKLEVFWGVAGTILGLLALDGPDAVERATWCGEHLLRMRREDPGSGLRAWATSGVVPETGFAHGSSGIAHALLELHRCTGDGRLYDAAMEAFAFERSVYREDLREWPDRRDQPADRPLMSSWCHGAPGVGLSRLAALDVVRPDDEPAIASDLLLALRKTSAAGPGGMNNLCCGTFGRVDILLEASRRLENPTLERQARRMADDCLARADGAGFTLPDYAEEEPHLRAGLWQGLAGVGYALLRLADPERYPCILAMA